MTTPGTALPAYIPPKPDDSDFGPAMLALSEKQRLFVINMVELGGGPTKYAECARRAGYSPSDGDMRQQVYKLVHSEKIQAALEEEAKRRLKTGMVQAVSGLLALAEKCQDTDPKVALKAYEAILNRTGLPVQTEKKVTVEHKMSDKELMDRVGKLGHDLGVDISKLLPAPDVVEGEFVEVTPVEEDQWTAI